MRDIPVTPYEKGNGNQTTDWADCIAFYTDLEREYPAVLRFSTIGVSDAGVPIHAGVVSGDGVFEPEQIKRAGRTVFFNNNGIHPGEPEGIDACMALVRDLCVEPARLAALGETVLLFVPLYNVDGALNRASTSRVNQEGPEQFGFRGNSRHLDLNRDFVKCESRNTEIFNQLFAVWDPDVMVDTHTSNGADYPYTMTLIYTQPDKLGGGLGEFLRSTMLPHLFDSMNRRGWPMCPYVNPIEESPEQGLAEFLETPRFSTGYAALHHTIGFMPETHMLKPFADRYASMRALVESALAFTVDHGAEIQGLRKAARAEGRIQRHWPVFWSLDKAMPSILRFRGYQASHRPSVLGDYQRLFYDREAPWERDVTFFNRYLPDIRVDAPKAYVVPRAWHEVIERLEANGVQMERLADDQIATVQYYRIVSTVARPGTYEGRLFHDEVHLERHIESCRLKAGDCWISLDQDRARYAVETLEPHGHDSFFRWGFFNSVLEKKETFSDYVFEDHATEILNTEPALRYQFEQWKNTHPELISDQRAVLDFIFAHCQRYAEPEWRRYPVLSILKS